MSTRAVWNADGYLYLTVGVIGDSELPADHVELPQGAPGAGRLLELALVRVQPVRRTPGDDWVPAGPSRLAATSVRAGAQPQGARITAQMATALGVGDRDVVRLRPPTPLEMAGQPQRRKEVRDAVGASLVGLTALVGGLLAAQSPDGVSWPKAIAAVAACAVALTFAYLRGRAAVRNRG